MAKLGKKLNLLDIFCLATGAMVSSGIFILPGQAHAKAGPAVIFSYFLAGLLATTGMLSIGEMVTAMPKAGGDYYFISRSLGSSMGTVAGLLSWFSLSLKSAFALVGMSIFTTTVANVNIHLVAVLLCLLFLVINLLGVKEASRFQIFLVGFLLALMGFYIFRGVPEVKPFRLIPFAPRGISGVFATAGFVFVAYGGLLKISSVAEEVRDYRIIPAGLFLALVVVIILYTLMVFVTTGVLENSILDNSLTPISDGAAVFLGFPGRIALGTAAILAFVSTANAGIMAASRYLLALSRDGLLPGFLSQVNSRFQTPHNAILVTGLFMIAVLFLNLETLVKAASVVLLLTFFLANLSVIILRESKIQGYRPTFQCPFYPVVQIIGMTGCALLIFENGWEAILMSLLLIVSGFLIYFFYGKIKASREHALLHLIERLTAKDLSRGILESELREVIREKDSLRSDRFDRLIEQCPIVDIEKPLTLEELFHLAAEKISRRIKVAPAKLAQMFLERERETTTVISTGVAIPHIVVEGKGIFEIVPIRCRPGVVFNEKEPPVQAIFLMVGSIDERNFHLRALSAIAQIIQNKNFYANWLSARNKESLRNLLLLGERIRHQCP